MSQIARNVQGAFNELQLRSSENLAQSEISQCKDFDRRWSDLIICPFLFFEPHTKNVENAPRYIVSVSFDNKMN